MTALSEGDATTARPVRARWWVMTVAALVGLLLAVSGAAALVRDDRRLAEEGAIDAAAGRATAAVAELASAVPAARAALDGSAGHVGDEAARTALAAAIGAAQTAAHAHGATVDEIDAAVARVVASRDALVGATSAVTAEVSSWELARAKAEWSQAATRLDATLSAARGVLDGSAGRVADDAVRQALARAVDLAQVLAGAAAPLEAPALSAAAAALAEAAASLAAPQAAVTDAVASWTKAEAAAARATAQSTASGAHSSATKAPSGTSLAAAPQGPPATDDGHWETTVTYEDMQLCMDTEGNSWEC